MCGIAGLINKRGRFEPTILKDLALTMADRMAHRGPDDSGVWVSADGRCALSHRRLSIIDTSQGGHQPMLADNGRRALCFNGEIYNFLELKGLLEASGVRFRSHSDTEVLLELLGREHENCLARLDGMFAFAHYDESTGELLLARDIFGEKPLYCCETDDWFAFASELHCLTGLPGFDAGIELDAISRYLSLQYVPCPLSIYRSVRKLPPASALRLSRTGDISIRRYFDFRTSSREREGRPIAALADELEALLITSVRRRLISDVPLGAFLSGGVDSSTVVAIARKVLERPIETFSIGFQGHADSEHFDAAAIADMLGTTHRDQVLAADAMALGRTIGAVLDEPNGDSSCLPTYLLSQFARKFVTVALSGDGGDEMFGGYARYFVTADEDKRKRAGDASLGWWKAGEVYLSSRILVYPDDHLRAILGAIPDSHARSLQQERAAIDADGRPMINVMRELDAHQYMPGAVLAKVDRMSMQHSLEVRAPLIGLDVARFAMSLGGEDCYSDGIGKRVLKQVAYRYLPEAWMNRPKRGFGMPMDLWSAEKLLPATRSLLQSPDARLPEWIDRSLLRGFMAGLEKDFNAYRCWSLFVLEAWLQTHPAVAVNKLMPATARTNHAMAS